MKELLGFVLIHPEKEDFVFGMHLDDGLEVVLYAPTPANAKVFKDFEEIKDFVSYLEDFTFDIAKLFDANNRYEVEYETSVSSRPIN